MTQPQKHRPVHFAVDWRAAVFMPSEGGERAAAARVFDVSKDAIGITLEVRLAPGAVHRMAMAIPSYDQSGPRFVTGAYRVADCFLARDGAFSASAQRESMDAPDEEILMWFLREEARRLEWAYSRTTGKFEFVKEAY